MEHALRVRDELGPHRLAGLGRVQKLIDVVLDFWRDLSELHSPDPGAGKLREHQRFALPEGFASIPETAKPGGDLSVACAFHVGLGKRGPFEKERILKGRAQ